MPSSACPWHFWEQQEYPFCETQLCGWVVEPANTWTNVGYLLVGLFILLRKNHHDPQVRHFFGWSILFLAFASAFYHGSGTHFGKLADVSAMFLYSMGVLCLSLRRSFNSSMLTTLVFYAIGITGSLTFLFVYKFGNLLFFSQIILAVMLEVRLARRGLGLKKDLLGYSLAVLGLAMLIWILDMKKILCWPDNHILSGHGLWHLLTALAMWLLYKAYDKEVALNPGSSTS